MAASPLSHLTDAMRPGSPRSWAGTSITTFRISRTRARVGGLRTLCGSYGDCRRRMRGPIMAVGERILLAGSERNPGPVVAEPKLSGQPGVVEGADEVVAAFAEVGPAVVVG